MRPTSETACSNPSTGFAIVLLPQLRKSRHDGARQSMIGKVEAGFPKRSCATKKRQQRHAHNRTNRLASVYMKANAATRPTKGTLGPSESSASKKL
jgi:hypothetical protein